MFKFKAIFSNLLLKTDFEKGLHELLSDDTAELPKEKISSRIILTLTNRSPSMSIHKAFWLISANFRYFMRPEPVLKLLSIFHICLSDCPNEFCPVFTENKIKALTDFKPKDDKDLRDYTHSQIIKLYYNYLYEASRQFEEFNLCRNESLFDEQINREEFKTSLQIFENFIEILKFGTNIQSPLEYSLIHFSEPGIVKQIAVFVIIDCIFLYARVRKFTEKNIGKIFEIKGKDEILKLYRIYENLIQITKRIKGFCLLKSILKDERIQCPLLYEITDEENSKIELFVNKLTKDVSNLSKKCLIFDIPKFGDLNHIVLKQNEELSGNQTLKYLSKSIHFEPASMKNAFGTGKKAFGKDHSSPPKAKTCKFNVPLRKVGSNLKEEEYKETESSEKL